MTLEKFKALCDAKNGTLETHPHCGGANSCAGFSYDQTIQVYSEHECKGLNTCTGWTCVLPKLIPRGRAPSRTRAPRCAARTSA